MLTGGDDGMKRKLRWSIDILMTLALFFLMGYHFWGETAHEWAGAGMFILFIAHQILNRGWYQILFCGKYTLRASQNVCPSGTGELRSSRYTLRASHNACPSGAGELRSSSYILRASRNACLCGAGGLRPSRYTPVRILLLSVNILTLAAMVLLMYSGITMSRLVFAFLPAMCGMAAARRFHLLGSYWGFLLMSLHIGLHWGMVGNGLGIKQGIRNRWLCFAGSLLAAVYGVYVFAKRDFLTYLFLKSEFVFLDYAESKILFYLDYMALMGLCIFITHYGSKLLRKRNRRRLKSDLKKGADDYGNH